jgi:hypothetical protein
MHGQCPNFREGRVLEIWVSAPAENDTQKALLFLQLVSFSKLLRSPSVTHHCRWGFTRFRTGATSRNACHILTCGFRVKGRWKSWNAIDSWIREKLQCKHTIISNFNVIHDRNSQEMVFMGTLSNVFQQGDIFWGCFTSCWSRVEVQRVAEITFGHPMVYKSI